MNITISRRKMKGAGFLSPGASWQVANLGIEGTAMTILNSDQFKLLYYRVRTSKP